MMFRASSGRRSCWTYTIPVPLFAASSIPVTWAFHARYGRVFSPMNGLCVRVTMLLETATVTFHPQNGSLTTSPSEAAVPYVPANAVVFITTRAGTSWTRGRSKILLGSGRPYPSSGGTITLFVSPTAIPRTPWSNPLIEAVQLLCCPGGPAAHPPANEKFAHDARPVNDTPFG